MANLALETKQLDFKLEQVQDFTPTPMTLATETYYSGYHPYTLDKVVSARSLEERQGQRRFFFWYKQEYRKSIIQELRKMGRNDLVGKFFPQNRQGTINQNY